MNATADLFRLAGAELSQDGRFRYRLWRALGEGPTVAFVMLNPSVADAAVDDPTIRRCLGFARAWGSGRLEVVNLFALRATNPDVLLRPTPPGVSARTATGAGDENDAAIRTVVAATETVVCAWGCHAAVRHRQLQRRVAEVLALLPPDKRFCLGVTQAGHPRHPRYLPADARPEPLRRSP